MSQWINNNPAQSRLERWLSYWNLLISLASRDIRARYRRTFLGPLWAIIPAILATLVLFFLGGLLEVETDGAPRLLFVFAATLPWTFFQNTVVRIPYGVAGNGTLLRKMPVPRQIFPFVVLLTNFFDFLMSGLVLVATLLIFALFSDFELSLSLLWLWLLPLTALLSFLGWAVGIGITSFTIYRRDLLHGIQHIMQVWLFASPVMYPVAELSGSWEREMVRALNPVTGIIDGFRQVIVYGQPPDLGLLANSVIIICLGLAVAYPLYSLMSRYFADVL